MTSEPERHQPWLHAQQAHHETRRDTTELRVDQALRHRVLGPTGADDFAAHLKILFKNPDAAVYLVGRCRDKLAGGYRRIGIGIEIFLEDAVGHAGRFQATIESFDRRYVVGQKPPSLNLQRSTALRWTPASPAG